MPFLSQVYLRGEDKWDITQCFLGCEPAVLFLIGELYYEVFALGTWKNLTIRVMSGPLLQQDPNVNVFVADLPVRHVSSKQTEELRKQEHNTWMV